MHHIYIKYMIWFGCLYKKLSGNLLKKAQYNILIRQRCCLSLQQSQLKTEE